MNDRLFDAVVVGAGPAGLAASWSLARRGARALLVDAGGPLHERSRSSPGDLPAGVGGAGLFSDGKFSFFPAASALWALPDREALDRSWGALAPLLRSVGLDPPPLPHPGPPEVRTPGWAFKPYPSFYVPIEGRRRLIDELFAPSAPAGRHRLRTRAMDARREGRDLRLTLRGPGGIEQVQTRCLVLAAGRFGPRSLALPSLALPSVFRRVEVGVRVEAAAGHPFFEGLAGVDPKWLLRDGENGPEFRTFCLCRGGEVVAAELDGLRCLSGRADGPPGGRSNLGLMARWTRDDGEAERALRGALEAARGAPWSMGLGAALGGLEGALPGAGQAVAGGLRRLVERFPALAAGEVAVRGPCLEGLGRYPGGGDDLEAAPGVWAAGDGSGRFRGLVAALVSGLYVAERVEPSSR